MTWGRPKGIGALVATAALAATLTACSEPEQLPTIPEEQISTWRAEGSALVPNAQEFYLEDGTECPRDNCMYSVSIGAAFATYDELAASEEALYAFVTEVAAALPEHYELTAGTSIRDGGTVDGQVEQAVRDAVPNLARVAVDTGSYDMLQPPPWSTSAQVFLFMDPDPTTGPDHLAQVMEAATPGLSARNARISTIRYYPADKETSLSGSELQNPPYGLNDFLPADDAVAADTCIDVGGWVFLVTDRAVSPAGTTDAPDARCEGKLG